MQRTIMSQLQHWLTSTDRQPLVLRGARQVGKTWLIRHLAKTSGKFLLELNFEKETQLVRLFESNSPQHILLNLGVMYTQHTPV
ncbi:MAG: AAA family ATPase [Legionellales bacterium]|nr:AAA family ATPase [Legionellales bacterium]